MPIALLVLVCWEKYLLDPRSVSSALVAVAGVGQEGLTQLEQ